MALNIKIDDTYSITSDAYNIILNKKSRGKRGSTTQTYYPNVRMALMEYRRRSATGGGILVDTLDKYLEELQNSENRISKILDGFKTKEDIF